jgi:hypothetical protein
VEGDRSRQQPRASPRGGLQRTYMVLGDGCTAQQVKSEDMEIGRRGLGVADSC